MDMAMLTIRLQRHPMQASIASSSPHPQLRDGSQDLVKNWCQCSPGGPNDILLKKNFEILPLGSAASK